ncbi:MAG TPA: 3'-5' exonuclease, partial [Opitutaceae bacterium]
GRMEIDYRLDAQLDHWLLDEFQDTSSDQWSVLRNLIDEAVQDPSGKRSFFCVGDVKQAIYAWRGGDPALFKDILEQYNGGAPGTIEERHLVDSYRSAPAVIEMVNATFGAAEEIAALFPGRASDEGNEAWLDHVSAKPKLSGQAALLHAEDREARFALTLRLIEEIAPLGRGLDCAVLTQGNALAAELADYLRREGNLPAVAESDLHVCTDNPLGAALLALVKAAAHPGDGFAQEHWKMTPLRDVLADAGVVTDDHLTHRLLGQIHAEGFERTMAYWVKRLLPTLAPDDDFSRERARQFVAAAALFDASGGREVADFVAFMERHTVRDAEAEGVIRVMTVHKSKGLGFDVVILPDLEGQRVDQRREGLAVQRAADRSVEWVLDLPPKAFYLADEVLSAHVREAEATAGYEALSLLYVAMTRAKRGMYVITEPVSPKSDSRNFPRLLADTLGREPGKIRVGGLDLAGTWSSGDAEWFAARAPEASEVKAQAEPSIQTRVAETARPAPDSLRRALRHPSLRPSSGRAGVVSAAEAFALEGGWAAALGDDVHRLLAEIEWLAPGAADIALDRWREEGVGDEVIAQAARCLTAPTL